MNAVMSEEDLRMARVLCRDEIDFSKHTQGPQSNVFEITNGSGNDVEYPGHAPQSRFEDRVWSIEDWAIFYPLSSMLSEPNMASTRLAICCGLAYFEIMQTEKVLIFGQDL